GDAAEVARTLRDANIVAGLPLAAAGDHLRDCLLVCCTEMTSPAAIDRYVDAAARVVRPAEVMA
ncbi:MAG TPA: hypothetical protein VG266_07385, partial [Candidatus Dormibacteraeota bacterium]|nr:hypothetical protein [Candidatus Dormibacteraeota bacterium]